MKLIAILKDSFREAVDTKVLYVTVPLSLLFVLFVFSISFRPLDAQEEANNFATDLNANVDRAFTKGNIAMGGQRPRFTVANFEQTNAGGQPWERAYHFQLVMEMPTEVPAEERQQIGESFANEMPRAMSMSLHWLWARDVTAKYLPEGSEKEIHILVDIPRTSVTSRLGWPHEPQIGFGLLPLHWLTIPLEAQLRVIADYIVGWVGAGLALLLSVVVTAFFIPNMLRKGTVDLLISKPMHRTTLLLYKFIGGLTFMVINTSIIMVGLYLAVGLRTGVWMNGLLLCIGVFTFQFAIFYAISTFAAVTTRSAIVAILLSVVAWGVLFLIGIAYRFLDFDRPDRAANRTESRKQESTFPAWVYTTGDIIHFITPHYKDLDALTTKLLVSDFYGSDTKEMKSVNEAMGSINWPETLSVTSFYIVALVGFSCFWFAWKDY